MKSILKQFNLLSIILILTLVAFGVYYYSQYNMHNSNVGGNMQHDANNAEHFSFSSGDENVMLSEAGNDAFGTIQEAIAFLENNDETDWTKVDLEALRLHLIDMNDMTLNVRVENKQKIKNGAAFEVIPTTERAAGAMERVFEAHPAQLNADTDWTMTIDKREGKYFVQVVSENPADADKIYGIGYIGVMAIGGHHQPHHLSMASGVNPHNMH